MAVSESTQQALIKWLDDMEGTFEDLYMEIERKFDDRILNLVKTADEDYKDIQNEIWLIKNKIVHSLEEDNNSVSREETCSDGSNYQETCFDGSNYQETCFDGRSNYMRGTKPSVCYLHTQGNDMMNIDGGYVTSDELEEATDCIIKAMSKLCDGSANKSRQRRNTKNNVRKKRKDYDVYDVSKKYET